MIKKFFTSKQTPLKTGGFGSDQSRIEPLPMSNDRLDDLVQQMSSDVKGKRGYWQLNIDGRGVLVVTDTAHNRMRIMTPIAAQDDLDEAELTRLLEANFGRALDAKYALRDKTLWAVFTHPLAQLTDEQFMESAAQVVNLANNFGGSYSSSNIVFGGG